MAANRAAAAHQRVEQQHARVEEVRRAGPLANKTSVDELLASRVWRDKVAAITIDQLRAADRHASMGAGGTVAPTQMSSADLEAQYQALANKGVTVVYSCRLRQSQDPLVYHAGEFTKYDWLDDGEKAKLSGADIEALGGHLPIYAVKVGPGTNHISGVTHYPLADGVKVFPFPHPGYEYARLIDATVWQAEIRDGLVTEAGALYAMYQATKGELEASIAEVTAILDERRPEGRPGARAPEAQAAGGAAQLVPYFPEARVQRPQARRMSDQPYHWAYPSTWANHPNGVMVSFVEMTEHFCVHHGCTVHASEFLRSKKSLLVEWANAADEGDSSEAFGKLGDRLAEHVRIAAKGPGAFSDPAVRKVMAEVEFADDPLGLALSQATVRDGRNRGGRGRGRGGARDRSQTPGDGKCYACGTAGHRATSCPDATKKLAWYESMSRGRGGGRGFRGGGW
jgi:hypothetical protein